MVLAVGALIEVRPCRPGPMRPSLHILGRDGGRVPESQPARADLSRIPRPGAPFVTVLPWSTREENRTRMTSLEDAPDASPTRLLSLGTREVVTATYRE